MSPSDQVLVIGAGIAGMEASLLLAKANKKVILVEKLPLIGGNTIKSEESFPNLECSTCMVAPVQQDVLQNPNIDVLTLSTVENVEGEVGNFTVQIHKKARYVSLTDCIGCDMCYEPCPVSIKNEWEENLTKKKAISVPCAGALPNVPCIDPEHCLQLNDQKECHACAEACMFGAIDLTDKDETIDIHVGAIIVTTGFELADASKFSNLGYGKFDGVYTAMEFERLFASNGPTSGEIILRDGEKVPRSIAIIHCVGRKEFGYCSGTCCMSSFKHAHFLKDKCPEADIYNLYSDICVPDKAYQKFFEAVTKQGMQLVFQPEIHKIAVKQNGTGLNVVYVNGKGIEETISVDMVILACAMVPSRDACQLGKVLGIDLDEKGFFSTDTVPGSIKTSKTGIFVAGCAEGPKDSQRSVIQAESAVSSVLRCL